jgi:D-3-phosphoglycerate dehydrogenase / 2-oxoglutarate reductase
MARDKGRVLLLENIHPGAMTNLEAAGYEVDLLSKALEEDDLAREVADCVAIGVRSKTQVSARALEAGERLRAVCAFCIGTNQIALPDANRLGVPAFNAPFSNTRSVAELVIAEIVFLARKMGDRNRQMHAGQWRKSAAGSHEVRGKTLGIVGYGHIGRQVGVLAEAMGLHVIFHDVVSVLPMGNNRPAADLDELLSQSDFVTLHVPATPHTEWMIGEEQLRKMKEGAYLLNLSRGNVVALEALAEAIRGGHLAGAAVDVYPTEPKTREEPFENVLTGLPNVILSPHIGGSTVEAQVAIGQEVSLKLIKFLDTGSTVGAVNFPQVDLGVREGAQRIQHVHRNVPGVLGDVHRAVAARGANIVGQVLGTDETVGYLLMDVAQGEGAALVDDIRALDTTIHARLLY